jgi:hypothetical protein
MRLEIDAPCFTISSGRGVAPHATKAALAGHSEMLKLAQPDIMGSGGNSVALRPWTPVVPAHRGVPLPSHASRLLAVLFRYFCLLSFVCMLATSAFAQDQPLQTSDADIVPAGTVRAQVGFDFLQDATFPLTALTGDQTVLGDMNLRLGLGSVVEVQLQGAVEQFLSIKSQGVSFVPLHLSGPNSASDSGNYSLWTKVHILSEIGRRPAVGFRFGLELPNAKQVHGLGTNTTNVYAEAILQKHFGQLKVFGDLGIGILQVPLTLFSQNDVIIYGAAFTYPLRHRLTLMGEVAGRQSTRKISNDLIGTESHSQARLGFQFLAGGFQWDLAGIAGILKNDPTFGFTFGVGRDIPLFKIPSAPR